MYCPHCGTENGVDVNFCRKCGEDLRLTSEAMTRRIGWSSFIWSKVDDRLASRHLRSERDAGINIFIGIVVVLLTVYYMMTGQGALAFWLILALTALLGIGIGIYDTLIYRRSLKFYPREDARLPGDLSIFKGVAPPVLKPRELDAAQPSQPATTQDAAPTSEMSRRTDLPPTPPSVTESTTRHLNSTTRETKETRTKESPTNETLRQN